MARVLVIEDDPAIADLIRLYLRHAGFEVDLVGDGVVGLGRFEETAPAIALVVLDLMLPALDGRGVCRRIRAGAGGRPDVPILMLTALDDDRDKLEGFRLGADDYLTKPFNPDELVARVRSILKRAAGSAASGPGAGGGRAVGEVVALGAATLDLAARHLLVGGRAVGLRTKEFDLLALLAARPGVVVARETLTERIWGSDHGGESRTVDVHVSRLREKLDAAGTGLAIETVRSVGYRLVVPGG